MTTTTAAVISDIHDNYHNLIAMLLQLRTIKPEKIFFLGDFMNAGIARTLAEFEIPTHGIWGNNDGDRSAIMRMALSPGSNLTMASHTADIVEWAGRRIYLTHYPLTVYSMARSGDFDAVFYGHDHAAKCETLERCLILNPGELSAHKTGSATFGLYDAGDNSAEIITVEGQQVTVLTELVRKYRKK